MQEDVLRFYANTSFYVRDLRIFGIWYPKGSWNPSPTATEGQLHM